MVNHEEEKINKNFLHVEYARRQITWRRIVGTKASHSAITASCSGMWRKTAGSRRNNKPTTPKSMMEKENSSTCAKSLPRMIRTHGFLTVGVAVT